MDDYYDILGVDRSATSDQIKQAFRRLASKHHPDKGGDTQTFQKIQKAYDTLSDPEKKQEYDNPPQPQFHFNQGGMPPGFEGFFSNFSGFPGFENIFGQPQQRQQRNRTLNLVTQITLEESFSGKEMVANIQLPNGNEQIINVKIPAGIVDGTTLRLKELGDNSIHGLPRGDLHLTVNVIPHHEFERNGDDLIKTLNVSVFDAILGSSVEVVTIDSKILNVSIPTGIQSGTILNIHGHGMPNMRDNRFRGRLLLKVNVEIPTNLSEYQKDLIRQARENSC